jgi:hypothetical protein
MRRILLSVAAGLLLAPAAFSRADDAGSCGSYGTTVDFVGSPTEAARQAKKDQKLVFVLHVSGHFEDPKFT